MKKGLENYDFNKPDFEKSINDVYLSRLNKYNFCSQFIFKTPFIDENLMNNLDITIDLISNCLSHFIYLNCGPMKYPLPQENSFVTGVIIKENYKEVFSIKNIDKIFYFIKNEYSCFEIRVDYVVQSKLSENKSVENIIEDLSIIISLVRFFVQIPIIFTLRTKNEVRSYISSRGVIY